MGAAGADMVFYPEDDQLILPVATNSLLKVGTRCNRNLKM